MSSSFNASVDNAVAKDIITSDADTQVVDLADNPKPAVWRPRWKSDASIQPTTYDALPRSSYIARSAVDLAATRSVTLAPVPKRPEVLRCLPNEGNTIL